MSPKRHAFGPDVAISGARPEFDSVNAKVPRSLLSARWQKR